MPFSILIKHDEPVFSTERQCLQQHLVDHAEHRGARADAHGEGDEGNEREHRIAPRDSPGLFDVTVKRRGWCPGSCGKANWRTLPVTNTTKDPLSGGPGR